MDFLRLSQRLAVESGTVGAGNQPISVDGQTGRLASIVEWVRQAYAEIQNERVSWRWLRAEFSAETTAGTARYTAAGWNLPRFAEWVDVTGDGMSIYRTADGQATEQSMREIPFEDWRRRFDRGAQQQGFPGQWSISPAGEFLVGPIPDDTYTIRGEYRKAPQILVANTDIPEMPERFHMAIVYRAMMLLAEYDEGGVAMATAARKYTEMMADLRRDQLPRVMIGPPLA